MNRTHLSPLQKIIQPPQLSPRIFPTTQSPTTATASPTRALPPSSIPGPGTGTTAQDLLNNVLGFSRSKSDHVPFGLQQQQQQQQQGVASTIPQSSLLFGSSSFNSPTKSIWSSTSTTGQLGGGGHLAPSVTSHFPPSGSLAPGHERARSQSFSASAQPAVGQSQMLTNTQDSVYQGLGGMSAALPVGHVGGGYTGTGTRLGGHHQSLSFSGSRNAFQQQSLSPHMPSQSQQMLYDSQVSQAHVPPPMPIQDIRLQQGGHGGHRVGRTDIGGPDPFLYYDSGGASMNTFSGMGMPQSTSTVNQSIWGA